MPNFKQHADRLADLYLRRTTLQIELGHCDEDADARKLHITPAEGWPGKNDEARKTARDKAIAEDGTLKKIREQASLLSIDLKQIETEIAIEETRFKAARWETRQQLVEALRLYGITPEENNRASEGAFDDAADNRTDLAADGVLEDVLRADESEPVIDDIPF